MARHGLGVGALRPGIRLRGSRLRRARRSDRSSARCSPATGRTSGTLPVGGAAVVVLAAALVASRSGWFRSAHRTLGGALVGAVVALTLWIGVTMGWSIVGDRSWDAFNKASRTARSSGLGVVLAAVGRGSQLGSRLRCSRIVVGTTLVWALVAKAVPALDPEATASRGLASPSATGTRSHCWPTSRSCSGSGSQPSARTDVSSACSARSSCTSRRSRCCSRSRAPASSSAIGVVALWLVLGQRAGAERARARRVGVRPCTSRRGLGVHATGADGGRRDRAPIASRTAPCSACSRSSAPHVVASSSSPSVSARSLDDGRAVASVAA